MLVVLVRVQMTGRALVSTRFLTDAESAVLQHTTLAFLFSPAPAVSSLLNWPSMDSDGPGSPPNDIQGGAPYAEHLLKVSWAEAGGTNQSGQPQREGTTFCWAL